MNNTVNSIIKDKFFATMMADRLNAYLLKVYLITLFVNVIRIWCNLCCKAPSECLYIQTHYILPYKSIIN